MSFGKMLEERIVRVTPLLYDLRIDRQHSQGKAHRSGAGARKRTAGDGTVFIVPHQHT